MVQLDFLGDTFELTIPLYEGHIHSNLVLANCNIIRTADSTCSLERVIWIAVLDPMHMAEFQPDQHVLDAVFHFFYDLTKISLCGLLQGSQ